MDVVAQTQPSKISAAHIL